jgi:hypothetical protein
MPGRYRLLTDDQVKNDPQLEPVRLLITEGKVPSVAEATSAEEPGRAAIVVRLLPTTSPNCHTPCITIPIAEKGQVDFRVEVAGVIFGEPIDKPQGGGSLEIGSDGLSAIYQFVRYDAVPRFEIFFPK